MSNSLVIEPLEPELCTRTMTYVTRLFTSDHAEGELAFARVMGRTEEECAARATLLAAAPELLAACRALVAEFDHQWPSWSNESGGCMAARAAIARARAEGEHKSTE